MDTKFVTDLGPESIKVLDPDDWKHRSDAMCCATCMWYVPKSPSTTLGQCRRRAPTLNGWPAVFTADWCGDHKLDETKGEGKS